MKPGLRNIFFCEVIKYSYYSLAKSHCIVVLASHLRLYVSVTKQYNLVPAKGVISLAGKLTAGLVESNGSLPPGL